MPSERGSCFSVASPVLLVVTPGRWAIPEKWPLSPFPRSQVPGDTAMACDAPEEAGSSTSQQEVPWERCPEVQVKKGSGDPAVKSYPAEFPGS